MEKNNRRVCPAEHAGWLVNPMRSWFQSPERLLRDYVKKGMTVLDIGCGPGFFSVPMATMVGEAGKVIAVDIQEGMLDRLEARIRGKEIEGRIQLHQSQEQTIGLSETVDFALAFYVVHEVPDQEAFFQELKSILNPGAKLLVVEPMFHVSKKAFGETVAKATAAGFATAKGPGALFSRSIVLQPE